jgi:hypothetical protein
MSSNVTVPNDFITIDINQLMSVAGGDGQESADVRWGRRIGGVLGAGAGAAGGFLAGSAVTANPIGGVIGAGAGGAAGQYAGESYGAHRGASGLAFDALMNTNPVTGTANALYQGYHWLRGK